MQQPRLKENPEGNLCGPKEGKPRRPGADGSQKKQRKAIEAFAEWDAQGIGKPSALEVISL